MVSKMDREVRRDKAMETTDAREGEKQGKKQREWH